MIIASMCYIKYDSVRLFRTLSSQVYRHIDAQIPSLLSDKWPQWMCVPVCAILVSKSLRICVFMCVTAWIGANIVSHTLTFIHNDTSRLKTVCQRRKLHKFCFINRPVTFCVRIWTIESVTCFPTGPLPLSCQALESSAPISLTIYKSKYFIDLSVINKEKKTILNFMYSSSFFTCAMYVTPQLSTVCSECSSSWLNSRVISTQMHTRQRKLIINNNYRNLGLHKL